HQRRLSRMHSREGGIADQVDRRLFPFDFEGPQFAERGQQALVQRLRLGRGSLEWIGLDFSRHVYAPSSFGSNSSSASAESFGTEHPGDRMNFAPAAARAAAVCSFNCAELSDR